MCKKSNHFTRNSLKNQLAFWKKNGTLAAMKLENPSGEKKVVVQKNESLEIFLEDFAPGSREFFLEIELAENNSRCKIFGRTHAKNSDKKSWTIVQNFNGKNQIGQIELRGVAENKSHLELNATGILEKKSVDANARISEKILLFDDARGRALPILTVKTDHVKSASHAASITPVNDENLLFLTSRGISPDKARQILKNGFLHK
ncbi:hypothetical protein HN393_02075 [bacterium]|nr:hypothetical protein [bacterium]